MSKIMQGVIYLEDSDFNADNSLKPHVTQGKPCVVMVQGNFCGYCTKAKPAFEQFTQTGGVTGVTLQIDGGSTEKPAAKRVPALDKSYRGVPTYLGFGANGKFIKTHQGGRDLESLKKFAASL